MSIALLISPTAVHFAWDGDEYMADISSIRRGDTQGSCEHIAGSP